MKTHKTIAFIFALILLSGCVDRNEYAYKYESNPTFGWGYAEFFGKYYSGYDINKNVLSLSLFTDSLKVNDKGNLTGFGQYLFFEDIFLNEGDTILPDGVYNSSDNYHEFTFTPGSEYEIDGLKYTIGAYMVFVEKDASKSKLQLIKEGSFTVNSIGSKQSINCTLILDNDSVIHGKFTAPLPYLDESVSASLNVRKRKVNIQEFLK